RADHGDRRHHARAVAHLPEHQDIGQPQELEGFVIRVRRGHDVAPRPVMGGEDGFAMVTVIILLLVMSLLSVVLVANISSELNGSRRQRNITTARAAADSGVDDLVFQLQQSTGGILNWDGFVTSFNTAGLVWSPWKAAGKGQFHYHVDCESFDCVNGDS